MATCGYEDIRAFHRAEVMVAPALQTEGKQLQREQHVGMGSNGRGPAVGATGWVAVAGRAAADASPRRCRIDLGVGAVSAADATRARRRCWCSTSAASTRS